MKAADNAKTEKLRGRFLRKHEASEIRTVISECNACSLRRTCKVSVSFYNEKLKSLAIIGEAPGKMEVKLGEPFVGKSGKLLDSMIEAAGYKRSDVVIMNMVSCRPPQNRKPMRSEVDACDRNLELQLNFSGAWIVLLMGSTALIKVLPNRTITDVRGRPVWKGGRIYIPTFHPAYVLRNPRMKKKVIEDIRLAFDFAYEGKWIDPPSVRDLVKASTKDGAIFAQFLDSRGWAVIDSITLDDRIIVVRNPSTVVPAVHAHRIRYTVEELVRTGQLGVHPRVPEVDLQAIHLVKQMGGTVVR